MRVFSVLLVLLICLVGLGFYQGWFAVTTHSDASADPDKVDVTLTVDKEKIKSDGEKLKEQAGELAGGVKQSASELGSDVREMVKTPGDAAVKGPLESTKGTIEKVDLERRQVTVKTQRNEVIVVDTDPSTEIVLGPEKTTLEKVRPGDSVVVEHHGKVANELNATRLTIVQATP